MSLGRGKQERTIQRKCRTIVANVSSIHRRAARTGGVFLAVDPKDDDLVGYHVKFGFERLAPHGPRRRMIRSLR
jgi:hypothetical protein